MRDVLWWTAAEAHRTSGSSWQTQSEEERPRATEHAERRGVHSGHPATPWDLCPPSLTRDAPQGASQTTSPALGHVRRLPGAPESAGWEKIEQKQASSVRGTSLCAKPVQADGSGITSLEHTGCLPSTEPHARAPCRRLASSSTASREDSSTASTLVDAQRAPPSPSPVPLTPGARDRPGAPKTRHSAYSVSEGTNTSAG
ncbi:hypothetical protein VTO73DRAFT_43 [Trametes versicolor]